MLNVGRGSKPLVFEGLVAEQYKRMRNKWIRLSLIGIGLPFIFPIIIGFFNDTLNFLSLFGNGEIVLSLFSLNLPLVFDLFELKNDDDEYMSKAFWRCTIIAFLQLAVYCSIKMSVSTSKEIKSIIASLVMVMASWMSCSYAIKTMFQYSISDNNKIGEIDQFIESSNNGGEDIV